MSVVALQRTRVERDDLPHVCLRCGAKATVRQAKTFSKSQDWTFITIFLGGLPYFLCCLLFRNYLRVSVPLCDTHRNHFRWQFGILWGGAALVATLVLGCFALMPHLTDAETMLGFKVTGGIAAAWVVILLVNRLYGITAAAVNDRDALIVGVSDRFVKAYERPQYAEVTDGW